MIFYFGPKEVFDTTSPISFRHTNLLDYVEDMDKSDDSAISGDENDTTPFKDNVTPTAGDDNDPVPVGCLPRYSRTHHTVGVQTKDRIPVSRDPNLTTPSLTSSAPLTASTTPQIRI